MLLRLEGRLEDSASEFLQALMIDSRSVRAVPLIAQLVKEYEDRAEFPAARDLLAASLSLAPHAQGLHERLIRVCLRSRDFAEAERLARECTSHFVDRPWPYHLYGEALLGLNRHDEAIEALRRGLGVEPDFIPIRMLLGRIYRKLGDMNNAQAQFRRILEVIPEHQTAELELHHIMVQCERAKLRA
jgi:tetratricopeptide (TPR) repeat protein